MIGKLLGHNKIDTIARYPQAVGNAEFVKRMRRGELQTVEPLAAFCEVLWLEFYVGPQRDDPPLTRNGCACRRSRGPRLPDLPFLRILPIPVNVITVSNQSLIILATNKI